MELATYIGIEPRSAFNASGSTIARGLRVSLNASGQIAIQDATARGDYVTLQDIPNNESGLVASMQGGGKIPVQAGATFAVGDYAYAAAGGQIGTTNTNALIGRCTQPGAANKLTEVELLNPK